MSAIGTLNKGGEPSAIKKQDDLFFTLQAVLDLFDQHLGEDGPSSLFLLFSHVHDVYVGQWPFIYPFGQMAAGEFPV